MKFVTFEVNSQSLVGVICDDQSKVVAIKSLKGFEKCETMIDLIEKIGTNGLDFVANALKSTDTPEIYSADDVTLLSPIPRPIHDVICVGVNYAAHFEECQAAMPMEKPEAAVYFSKRSNRILGATEDIPHTLPVDEEFDYEVELAVIIGKECKNVKAADAKDCIFGYSVFNDLSARTLQKAHKQWYRGKGLDNTSVMGPYIVPASDINFPPELEIKSYVNGDLRQNSNTNMLVHGIDSMIEDLSAGCTLEPGDIIITGTPAGVGMGFTPPNYLKVGDVYEAEIENVGKHCNKIVK